MTLPDYPPYVQFETSFQCNAACIMCPSRFLMAGRPIGIDEHGREMRRSAYTVEPRPLQMSEQLIQKLVDGIGEHREAISTVIPFIHGEPLLFPGMLSLVKNISSYVGRNKIYLSTNAALLSGPLGDAVRFAFELGDIGTLVFSIDGYENFERVRVGLERDQVYKNVKDFIGGLFEWSPEIRARLRVDMTVCRTNMSDLPQFAEYWDARDVNWNFAPADDRVKRVASVASEALSSRSVLPCRCLWESVYILTDGTFVPCCVDWRGEHPLGNLKDNTISEVWHGEAYRALREKHIKMQKGNAIPCATCGTHC